MKKTAMIIDLYFIQKKNLSEIADEINTSTSYVSKILRKDKRYKEEKINRTNEKLIKRRKKQKEHIYAQRKNKQNNYYINTQILKQLHDQDIRELSNHSMLGNQAIRKWCGSAYKYNSDKNRYEFDTENLTRNYGLPLYIKA